MGTYKDDREEILSRKIKVSIGRRGVAIDVKEVIIASA